MVAHLFFSTPQPPACPRGAPGSSLSIDGRVAALVKLRSLQRYKVYWSLVVLYPSSERFKIHYTYSRCNLHFSKGIKQGKKVKQKT